MGRSEKFIKNKIKSYQKKEKKRNEKKRKVVLKKISFKDLYLFFLIIYPFHD